MSDDLVKFLSARLDEDEVAARAAAEEGYAEWRANADPGRISIEGRHITRHDPARVLREVEAKRKILAEIVPLIRDLNYQVLAEYGMPGDEATEHLPLLKIMAAVYSDHPDYRTEWAPTA